MQKRNFTERMRRWLKSALKTLKGNLEVVNTTILIVGLAFTAYQVYQAKNALIAANSYNINRDARDISDKVLKNMSFISCLRETSCDDEKFATASSEMAALFNFYYSIYKLDKLSSIDSEFANLYKTDFCLWFKRAEGKEFVEKAWNNILEISTPNASYKTMRQIWCNE